MKANLEFDLPEERDEFKTAIEGYKYRLCLSELDTFLRNKLKYEDLSDEEFDAFEKTRTELYRILEDNDVNIHD